jgi:DNA-binding NarL/FixJ family response regulator
MGAAVVRVLLCEPSEPFSRLVGLWLEPHPDLELVAVAHHRDIAVALIAETRPDVIVLDAMLHNRAPLLPSELRRIAPKATLIVYSGHVTPVARHVAPGADAYVHKRGDSRELLRALRGRRFPPSRSLGLAAVG